MAEGGTSTAAASPSEGVLTEWLLRGFAVLLFAVFIINIGHTWMADTSRYTLLMLLLTESLTLGLVIFARRAIVRDMSPLAVAATIYACLCFVLFGYADTHRLIPESVGFALQTAGLIWQVASKAVLGRCFGLLPAARGLVTRGPYRVVRHPIYMGYLIAHIGFLLTNFSWQNLAVLVVLYAAQVVRMGREETMLDSGEQRAAYGAYRATVRYRLVPFVY